MSILVFLGFFLDLVFQSGDSGKVLLFFQKDSVSFQVGIFDSLLALTGQLENGFLFFFIEGNSLLLVFQQGHQMVIFLGSGLQFGG